MQNLTLARTWLIFLLPKGIIMKNPDPTPVRADVPSFIAGVRSHWSANPEKPQSRPHWSADESLVRPHRAAYTGAIRERRSNLVMAAMLGMTLEELNS